MPTIRRRIWSASPSPRARAPSRRVSSRCGRSCAPAKCSRRFPGVVISQHSGEGKANQYYLRGFNLDHGTDFATTVAGIPVNMPTHGHGHGYSDLELPHPRARERRAVRQGPVLRGPGRLRDGGLGEYQLHQQPRRSRGRGSAPGRTASSARSSAASPRLGTRHAAGRIRSGTQRWSVGHPRRLREAERPRPLHAGRHRSMGSR